uniref:Zinc finger translocation associated n=1 Tax=Oryzias melastigma TaxID=30732 RepID=A0A3B3D397_ORYME
MSEGPSCSPQSRAEPWTPRHRGILTKLTCPPCGARAGGQHGSHSNGFVTERVPDACRAAQRGPAARGDGGGPDQPLLLSPAPGPPGRKPRVQRASRPGLSRIPGRDHRRYYHEYWRSEYLMDFDAQRHGMICMVCGSSLATLKLSTIKRHIRQKHPDSLLWSAADKEVIRSGWESHLSLGGAQRSFTSAAETSLMEEEEEESLHLRVSNSIAQEAKIQNTPDAAPICVFSVLHPSFLPPADPADHVTPPEKQQEASPLSPHSAEAEPLQEPEDEQEAAGPSAQTLERYLNDSLHAWFRQEFLMEYEAEAGRLLCMVCGAELPSLHLDHIKSHVLDSHPSSLVCRNLNAGCIRPQAALWTCLLAFMHVFIGILIRSCVYLPCLEESENSVKSEHTKAKTMDVCAEDVQTTQIDCDAAPQEDGTSSQDVCLIGEDGGVGALQEPPPKRRRRNYQMRWRLEYLMDYDCQRHGLICMVCGANLATLKVSTIKRHIQQVHAHSLFYSTEEKQQAVLRYNQSGLHLTHSDQHPDAAPAPPHGICRLTEKV